MPAVKIIEVMGVSKESWEDAANQALKEALKSVRNISGLEVASQTAKVKDGRVAEYHSTCKLAFRVE
jgi:flavin-binding protein dodecin